MEHVGTDHPESLEPFSFSAPRRKSPAVRFEEAADDVLNDYRTNGKRSLAVVERRITKHLMPFFGGRRMAAITTSDVRQFIAKRQADTVLVRKARLVNGETGWVTSPEQRKHVSNAEINRELTILKRAFSLASTTKNGEGRVFPMTAALRELLEDQRTERDRLRLERGSLCPSVFHRNGVPIKAFTKAWKTACLKAGCPGRIPHDLRRTAVRNLVRAGVPERVAMQITGHKTRSVFERYNIVSETDFAEAVKRLDDRHGHSLGIVRVIGTSDAMPK